MKQYSQPRRVQRQRVVEASKKRGLIVTLEGGDRAANLGMIMN